MVLCMNVRSLNPNFNSSNDTGSPNLLDQIVIEVYWKIEVSNDKGANIEQWGDSVKYLATYQIIKCASNIISLMGLISKWNGMNAIPER